MQDKLARLRHYLDFVREWAGTDGRATKQYTVCSIVRDRIVEFTELRSRDLET